MNQRSNYIDYNAVDPRPTPFTGSSMSPDIAWQVSKPIIVYGYYLFQRIILQNNLSRCIKVILSGNYEHRFLGEHPNRFLRLAMCMPLSQFLRRKISSGVIHQDDLKLPELRDWIMTGDVNWQYSKKRTTTVYPDDLAEISFMFGMMPYVFHNFPGLIESPKYCKIYEENRQFHDGLDFSNRLCFKVMTWKWRRFARRKVWIKYNPKFHEDYR
jgi:hypothetical protein